MLKNDKREVKTAKKKQHCIKTRPRPGPWNLDLRKIRPLKKNTPIGKTGPKRLVTLLLFSNHMEDNVNVIQFHIKCMSVFVQIMFEKSTLNLNFYFENDKAFYNQFATLFFSMECSCILTIFYAASFSIKTSFCETRNVFYLEH